MLKIIILIFMIIYIIIKCAIFRKISDKLWSVCPFFKAMHFCNFSKKWGIFSIIIQNWCIWSSWAFFNYLCINVHNKSIFGTLKIFAFIFVQRVQKKISEIKFLSYWLLKYICKIYINQPYIHINIHV